MKIQEIDNSLRNLGKTVLWQYDRAVRLLSVMKHMQVLYHCAVEQFWDFWREKVLSIETCGAFGCSVWGVFLGVPRPVVKGKDGKDRLIATTVYRKLLKGTFYLMKASSTFEDILGYLEIVFGVGGEENLSKWSVYVSEYGWTTNIDELNDIYKVGLSYKKGDIFSYKRADEEFLRNWKCLGNISAQSNTSFEAIENLLELTTDPTNIYGTEETLLLKLYDPEGVCRKIGGAPNNSLTITVEYNFGDTTIKAEATRRRKCGVMLIDNQDLSMEYRKSEYYDEMHTDQKALFEQKLDELCPFPLGIRTNEPVGRWVFGFTSQSTPTYKVNVSFNVGDIFGYAENDYQCCNYECISDISASENNSFLSIRDKLKKTKLGGPLIQQFGDINPPYLDIRPMYNQYSSAMTWSIGKNLDNVFSIIQPNRMFVGLDNGLYKIFKNITGKYIFVCWGSAADLSWYNEEINVLAYGADTSSMESHMRTFAQIAKTNRCLVVPNASAYRPQENTLYQSGDTLIVNGNLRSINVSIETTTGDIMQQIIDASSPISNAGIHEWYPYSYES